MTRSNHTEPPGNSVARAIPIRLIGDAQARGRGHGLSGSMAASAVRAAVAGQVELARAEGLIDAEGEAYLAEQRAFHEVADPLSLQEIAGIAEGYGMAMADVFAHLHLSLLRARKRLVETQQDGCSAWAVAAGSDGPMLVKNRDLAGRNFGVQRVMAHAGPDIEGGPMLCVGSLGSPAAYSSGINAWGLALADTHIEAPQPGIGWLRYFLMTRLLASCRSVAEAVAMIRAATHAGGGSLVLADRGGAVACVDFTGPRATVTEAPLVWRTNHYPQLAQGAGEGDSISGTSRTRFTFLERTLPRQSFWRPAEAASLMATHSSPFVEGSLLCAHRDTGAAETLSCAIYTCRDGRLLFSDGNPCLGRWARYDTDGPPSDGLASAHPK